MAGELESKSDQYLVEILRQGESEEVQRAKEVLYVRYFSKLERVSSQFLRQDKNIHGSDVAQDALLKFFVRVGAEPDPINNVENYLIKIAQNLCRDVLRRWKCEYKFEHNIPVEAPEDPLATVIALEGLKAVDRWLHLLPYGAGLADCPRIVWMLRWLYGASPALTARLLNKGRHTIDTHFSQANKDIVEYVHSDHYETDFPLYLQGLTVSNLVHKSVRTLIEQFAVPVTPELTPDELAPLNLPKDEFEKNYVASLIMVGPGEHSYIRQERRVYLLLSVRSDYHQFQNVFHQEGKGLSSRESSTRPNQCLCRLKLEEDHIHLRPLSLVFIEHNFVNPITEADVVSPATAMGVETEAVSAFIDRLGLDFWKTKLCFHNRRKNKYVTAGIKWYEVEDANEIDDAVTRMGASNVYTSSCLSWLRKGKG